MSSFARFVAAYSDTGCEAGSCTEYGSFVLAPYTELEDA